MLIMPMLMLTVFQREVYSQASCHFIIAANGVQVTSILSCYGDLVISSRRLGGDNE
jgi:hypothetical protein